MYKDVAHWLTGIFLLKPNENWRILNEWKTKERLGPRRARRTGGGSVTGADGVLADGVQLTHARVLRSHVHRLSQEELPVKPQPQC